MLSLHALTCLHAYGAETRHTMDKSLRKLSRIELLQLLLKVTETNEALLVENEKLRSIPPAPAPAPAPQMRLSQSAKVGSIAEAALQANGYFEAAQRAADDYLREIKLLRDQLVARANNNAAASGQRASSSAQAAARVPSERMQAQAEAYVRDVQAYADNVIAQANKHAESIVESAKATSDQIIAKANKESRMIIAQANATAGRNSAETVQSVVSSQSTRAASSHTQIQQPSAQKSSHSDPFATGELMRRGRHVKLTSSAVL